MMEVLFVQLLNMSISASWLILAIIILRTVLKKAPKSVICVMWALVAIRLVCPISIESILSLIPNAEPIEKESVYVSSPTVRINVIISNSTSNQTEMVVPSASISENTNIVHGIAIIASIVWIVGMLAILLYSLVSYIRLKRRVREGVLLDKNVWLCDHIDIPFILGVFRPRVYIPSSMDEKQMVYVIAHENAHIKRKDHWWKLLATFMLAVYWFNPIIWMAYILFCRDIEFACDECALKKMNDVEVKAYLETLLSFSAPGSKVMACPIAFGEIGVKSRIKTIVNYKKPAFWISIVAVCACLVVAACFLTNPVESKNEDNQAVEMVEEENIDYSILTEEQINYLKNDLVFEEFEIKEMSYEDVNWWLQGTGFELYNQSSGAEVFGITYMKLLQREKN